MIALLYVVAVALLVGAIYCWRVAMDFGPNDTLGVIGAFACGLLALVFFIIPTVILPSRAIGSTTCTNWSKQTGYPAKFRVLNWFDTGQCLARTPDGHWTHNTNIIVNVPAKP